MLFVNDGMVGCCASKIDAMMELAMLIKVMSEKDIIKKKDAQFIVDVAFMTEDEIHKKADEIKQKNTKNFEEQLKDLLQEMLDELTATEKK